MVMGRVVLGMTMLAALAPVALRAQAAPAVGQVAAVVSVDDLNGTPVQVVVTPGKRAAVVEFWATWCELCHALLPEMRTAARRFGTRVDFFGIDVTVNDGKDHVRRYVAENHPPFTTLYDDRGIAVRAFGAQATSHIVIIDQHGRIAYIGDGAEQKITAELARVVGP